MKLACKKNLILLLISLPLIAKAQEQKEEREEVAFSLGYGFFYIDPTLRYVHTTLKQPSLNLNNNSLLGPLYFNIEFPYSKQIAGQLSFIYYHVEWSERGARWDSTYTHIDTGVLNNKVTSFSIVGRLITHFIPYQKMKRCDPYMNFGFGIKLSQFLIDEATVPPCYGTDCDYIFPNNIMYRWPIVLQATVGLRVRIIPHLLIYGEAGFAKTFLQVGLTAQF